MYHVQHSDICTPGIKSNPHIFTLFQNKIAKPTDFGQRYFLLKDILHDTDCIFIPLH